MFLTPFCQCALQLPDMLACVSAVSRFIGVLSIAYNFRIPACITRRLLG